MAKISHQTLQITISKLVKNEDSDPVLTDNQLLSLLETLPGVVEELLQDSKLVVEVSLNAP